MKPSHRANYSSKNFQETGIVAKRSGIYGRHARERRREINIQLERERHDKHPYPRCTAVPSGRGRLLFALATMAYGADQHKTNKFEGPKANTGMAVHSMENRKSILRVTSDFKVPDTPAPTWRVVDSRGNIYTLDAFKIKGGEKREAVGETPS